MDTNKKMIIFNYYLWFTILNLVLTCMARKHTPIHTWVIKETSYARLCSTKNILTVNGQFPGPPIYARKGDTVKINVQNQGKDNVTIHWHGVKQPRNPWSDGPVYITQCPIKPGANFTYEVILSTEEGTLWWHAHSDWSRATVHGAFIVLPKIGTYYPFKRPHAEFPIILGSWYKGDVMELIEEALATGGEPKLSDSFTINGQPGDLYNCSKPGTFKMAVDYGKTYLLRIINSVMNEEMFMSLSDHTLTVVGHDGAYIKPITTNLIMITPGQTMDVLVTANRPPGHYYLAARAYAEFGFDETMTTAVFKYNGNYTAPMTPSLPALPDYNDTNAATNFTRHFRALGAVDVPKLVDTHLLMTIAINVLPCAGNSTCTGPNGLRLGASLNNVSFVEPSIDLLSAYYRKIDGVFDTDFPSEPGFVYNYTGDVTPDNAVVPLAGTKVRVLEYNASVEIVFQGTNVLSAAENHPMHLHGYSFYLVGSGFGNFNNVTDPENYNLVDPPEVNTIGVPKNGWAAIRFRADNPGVWFMHCHLERHSSWGMNMALIVKNGKSGRLSSVRRPPNYLNPC